MPGFEGPSANPQYEYIKSGWLEFFFQRGTLLREISHRRRGLDGTHVGRRVIVIRDSCSIRTTSTCEARQPR